MAFLRLLLRSVLALILLYGLGNSSAAAADWPPVSREELEMKSYPPKPGAHAVILQREERTDDIYGNVENYFRIKIFTEEGKKYANIEILYFKGFFRITDIKARTIRPDGSIIEFKGQVFDKTVIKARGIKFLAKTFSLPEVEAGSIIEYRYRTNWDPDLFLSTRWILQHELPARRAVFALKPRVLPGLRIVWIEVRLPQGKRAAEQKDRNIQLVLEDVPAFEEEENMPPENELKMRVDFFYMVGEVETVDKFWKREGQEWNQVAEEFIGKRGGIAKAVQEIVQAGDAPEVRLRKIYARVQQVRNLSYERAMTEKEEKRENIKDNNNIEDLWKRGYGYRTQINRLFVGLVRAAGLEATAVRVSERDDYFFNKQLLDANQLNGEITYVQAGGKEYYLDPGTLFCPFGVLSWPRSGVAGILLDKSGGRFITTPQPQSSQALVQRVANLELCDDGMLQGKLQVSYLGLEGLSRRLEAYDEDEVGKRKQIEDEIKGWLPSGARIQLDSINNWESSEEPLRIEATITMPGIAAFTGRRVLMPASIFRVGGRHPFQHANRIHPVYFDFPFQEVDDVTIALPPGLRVESLPTPHNDSASFAKLETRLEEQDKKLRLQRRFVMEGFFFRTEYYPVLRSFYDRVKAADEERLVLQTTQATQVQ